MTTTSVTAQAASPVRTAALDAALYIGLMAAGMAVMHHGLGRTYGDPEMMLVLLPVEVVLSLQALRAARRQGGLAAVGAAAVRPREVAWLLPLAVPLVAGLAALAVAVAEAAPAPGRTSLLLAAAATTALVGFSEELMFRGVLLHGAWRTGGLFRAMLSSALGFSSLHAVNVLGGSPPASVLVQLATTFVFGLATAPLAVRLGTIWPLMLLHWGWDFLLYGFSILGRPPPPAAMLFLVGQLVLVAAGWWTLRGRRREVRGEAP